jgi:hypothetical protein
MRTTKTLAATAAFATLLALSSACSSASTTATTTSAVAKSSDGAASGGAAGPAKGDQGDTASVALPDGWPEELALPDGLVVLDATDVSGGHSWVVHARVDGDAKGALDQLESQLTAADWTIVSSDFTESPQGGFGGISGTSRQQTVAIALGPDPTGDTTQVQIALADKTST